MIPGFNESIPHGDRVYHIQTEDLGKAKGLIVSQIFCDGQILHTCRSEYKDKLDSDNPDREIKKALFRQHRDMHLLIRSGELGGPVGDEATTAATAAAAIAPVGSESAEATAEQPARTVASAPAVPAADSLPTEPREPATQAVAAFEPESPQDGLTGLPPATGFLAELISDQRLDLVIALELGRLEAEGLWQPDTAP